MRLGRFNLTHESGCRQIRFNEGGRNLPLSRYSMIITRLTQRVALSAGRCRGQTSYHRLVLLQFNGARRVNYRVTTLSRFSELIHREHVVGQHVTPVIVVSNFGHRFNVRLAELTINVLTIRVMRAVNRVKYNLRLARDSSLTCQISASDQGRRYVAYLSVSAVARVLRDVVYGVPTRFV